MLLNYQPWDLDLCPKFDIMSNCWESLALTVYSMHKAYIYSNGLAQFSLSCECMKVITDILAEYWDAIEFSFSIAKMFENSKTQFQLWINVNSNKQ